MTPAEQIRRLNSVAECHEWRKQQGILDSATYLALLMRIEALRKLEAHSGQSVTATASRQK